MYKYKFKSYLKDKILSVSLTHYECIKNQVIKKLLALKKEKGIDQYVLVLKCSESNKAKFHHNLVVFFIITGNISLVVFWLYKMMFIIIIN